MADEAMTPTLSRRGTRLQRPEFIGMLAGLMAVNSLAIDIMLPAFPNIAAYYGLADVNDAQYVLLFYIVGFGAAQLAFGPISDRFGRRGPLFVGMVLYVACAVDGRTRPDFRRSCSRRASSRASARRQPGSSVFRSSATPIPAARWRRSCRWS